jgi:hypothetical protein
MTRYYFNFRAGDNIAMDKEGFEFADLTQVQAEASATLAAIALDDIREDPHRTFYRKAVEVRDHSGLVMEARFTFELRKNSRSLR